MEIYVYLDESGSIHKNSNTRYFAVGGYFCFKEDKNKIVSHYKKLNKIIKDNNNCDINKEVKSYDMKDKDKILIFNNIQEIDTFFGCVKVFDKSLMKKEIIHSNIFFNYAVKVLIKDCIVPILNNKILNSNLKFIISIDNRNIRVGELNNLETYLKTEFCIENFDFEITYYDSTYNFGIQMADLTVNTFYNYFKKHKIIEKVMPCINTEKYRISLFPGYKVIGRKKKIDYDIDSVLTYE